MTTRKPAPRRRAERRPTAARTAPPAPRRLSRDEREKQIVAEATRYFSEVGFSGDTRALAHRLHITQPLLFRYFASKEALIERVFEEVSTSRWNPFWPEMLADRSLPLKERLLRFYKDYSRVILTREWVRIFLFSGLRGQDINRRYLKLVRDQIYVPICALVREHVGLPGFETLPLHEMEVEAVRVLNEKIFYFGVRKWVHEVPVSDDIDAMIEAGVVSFLEGVPGFITQLHRGRR